MVHSSSSGLIVSSSGDAAMPGPGAFPSHFYSSSFDPVTAAAQQQQSTEYEYECE
jgi:hypothetical protein